MSTEDLMIKGEPDWHIKHNNLVAKQEQDALKIGVLTENGITETDLATAIKNDRSQLSETAQQISDISNPQTETIKTAVLGFIDDDIRAETYTYWRRLAQEKGIKISLACIPEWIETGYSTTTNPTGKAVMTKAQLKEMYDDGHDILAHGYSSITISNILDNSTELQHQLLDCREWLKNQGFTRNEMYNYWVHPQGLTGTAEQILKTKAEVRKYYKYGINAFTEKTMNGVFDSYNIPRVTGDGASADTLKAKLDEIIANKGWMIVLSHSWHEVDDGSYEAWSARYSALIDYALANGVQILPFSEAIKIKGNTLSIGEFTDSNKLFVNKDGSNTLQNVFHTTTYGTGRTMNDAITAYPENSETILAIQGSDDSFLGVGGIMRIVRTAKYMSYASYLPYNSNDVYKRRWIESATPNAWGSFEQINQSEKKGSFCPLNSDFSVPNTNVFTQVTFANSSLAELTVANGVFTATKARMYDFEVTLSAKTTMSANTVIVVSLFRNGVEQTRVYTGTIATGSFFTVGKNITLKLSVGDTVDVRIKSDQAITLYGSGVCSYLFCKEN